MGAGCIDGFLPGFMFGFACCALFASGCFVAYRLWLEHWLTTEGEDVKLQDTPDGLRAIVRIH